MNSASIIVLAAVFAAAGFAVWRNVRKGAPCSCGCGGGRACTCGCARGARALPEGTPRSCADVGGEGASHAK